MPGSLGAVRLSSRAWVALLAVYTIWGSTYLAIKVVVETMPPLLTAGARFLIAGLIMYAASIARARRSGDVPRAHHWRSAAIIGLGLCLGGNGLVNLAEVRISSGATAILIATVPLWIATFEWVRFRTKLPVLTLVGLIVGFAATAIMVRPPAGQRGLDLIGALLAVSASAFWAMGSLYARRAPLPRHPVLSTGMELIAGGIALLIAGALGGEIGRAHPSAFSRSSLLGLVYLITLGSIGGFTAYVWLLRNVRTTIVSTYAYVNPFVAVLLGFWLLQEKLTVTELVAGVIILASVALIVMTSGRAAGEVKGNSAALASAPVESARSHRRPGSRTQPAVRRRGVRR